MYLIRGFIKFLAVSPQIKYIYYICRESRRVYNTCFFYAAHRPEHNPSCLSEGSPLAASVKALRYPLSHRYS